MTDIPEQVWFFRLIHINNLEIYLQREALHAPNYSPEDGLVYQTIHNTEVQNRRRDYCVPCGPGGKLHDYVPFYLGYRGPMLLNLHTGRVSGYVEGQTPLIYLVSNVSVLQAQQKSFVFSDGHAIAAYTQWYSAVEDFAKLDWEAIKARQWNNTKEDLDRQRKKQAELLVYQKLEWEAIQMIVVYDETVKSRVEALLKRFPECHCPGVKVIKKCYY